ncbi:YqaA family protein [Jannaschia aquimarina]|uniref:SNARE associated Golgi protein n=1 Tax=Jannaschia aquimarina TaxID=935700 RepID=A0A0D1EG67_9RHOB|nr:YqaA family protein [Jannaschia aquimarina]KIT15901.1 SNARE associated Golgi protein [Jannaschia aquimarina]SNS97387.1 membrane protein YqaA, SNARE-associated domain [Jannaschia aquimarina]
MIRALYDWTMASAAHPRALWVLAIVSFAESSVFPIPPDVLMIPMIIATPRRAWLIAAVCTIASVLGALLGYAIGAFAFATIGHPVLELLGKADRIPAFQAYFAEWGPWAVLVAGVTPFPYKAMTILSGAASLSLPVFILSSIVARGLRFFLVAGLLRAFGAPIRDFIERRLGLVFTVFMVCLIGGFVLLRYL